jgi:hypothetical protein
MDFTARTLAQFIACIAVGSLRLLNCWTSRRRSRGTSMILCTLQSHPLPRPVPPVDVAAARGNAGLVARDPRTRVDARRAATPNA